MGQKFALKFAVSTLIIITQLQEMSKTEHYLTLKDAE